MDTPQLIDKYDGKLRQIMLDMRHDGIRHEVIHHLFKERTKDLETMTLAENDLGGSAKIP